MTYEARELARVRNPVLLLAAASWIVLVAQPRGIVVHGHAHAAAMQSASLQMLLAMNPPAALAAGWALMVLAMMSPLLIPSIGYVRQRSFRHRRARSIGLFVAGYGAVWMTAGAVILAIEVAVRLLAPHSILPAAIAALVAAVWQCSPIKQRALNRCHSHTALAAFGSAADLAALRFGLTHGIWCVVSCWALMLFPMLLPSGHMVAMAAAAVLVFSERLEPPALPSWRPRGLATVRRLAIAQARIRLLARGRSQCGAEFGHDLCAQH